MSLSVGLSLSLGGKGLAKGRYHLEFMFLATKKNIGVSGTELWRSLKGF
jgi:hypothetical protein